MTKSSRPLILPFSLTAGIVLVDQLTKWLVVRFIEYGPVPYAQLERFFLLVHQKNTGVAFSMGNELDGIARLFLLIVLPLAMLAGLTIYYFRSSDFSRLQRWALCGILGGGIGNMIDRIFRSDGVIDFLSVRIYGLFGMERWPTFNVADSAVVVGCLLILLTSFFPKRFRSA